MRTTTRCTARRCSEKISKKAHVHTNKHSTHGACEHCAKRGRLPTPGWGNASCSLRKPLSYRQRGDVSETLHARPRSPTTYTLRKEMHTGPHTHEDRQARIKGGEFVWNCHRTRTGHLFTARTVPSMLYRGAENANCVSIWNTASRRGPLVRGRWQHRLR